MKAIKSGETSAGKLVQTAPGSYITAIDINYKCRDWSTHTTRTHVFAVESFLASVSERDANIIQDLTITALDYTKGSGRPHEQPLAAIVWETPKIRPDVYEELGKGETHRLGSLIYSSDLGLGGVIHTTLADNKSFVLNSGLLVTQVGAEIDLLIEPSGNPKIRNDVTEDERKSAEEFLIEAKSYSGKFKMGLNNALYRTVMSSALSSAKMNLKHIYQTQCRLRQLVEAMQIYLHRNNPYGGEVLESKNGETYHLAGDLVRVSRCQRIENFTINWSRRWKGECIAEFPVNISGKGDLTFLEIHTRRIVKQPSQVPCDTLPDNIYVRNNKGTFYEISKQATISRTSLKFEADNLLSEVRINRGANYDEFEAEGPHSQHPADPATSQAISVRPDPDDEDEVIDISCHGRSR
jgi:hypothetical protein